jgi:hypothetical protein
MAYDFESFERHRMDRPCDECGTQMWGITRRSELRKTCWDCDGRPVINIEQVS